MTRIILLEGIMTAGKSSLLDALVYLAREQKKSYEIISEEEVFKLLPENKPYTLTAKASENYFIDLFNEKLQSKPEYIFTDRSHITHFMHHFLDVQNVHKIYKKLEQKLLKYEALLILLQLDRKDIHQNFEESMHIRGENSKFTKRIMKNGGLTQEMADFHFERQKLFLKALQTTKLSYKIIKRSRDTNFKELAAFLIDSKSYEKDSYNRD